MEFVWDRWKAASNLRKHGVDFVDAVGVFLDDLRIEDYDEEHSDAVEDRYRVIGMVEGVILFVVYTIREDVYRLISARKADRNECDRYYRQA